MPRQRRDQAGRCSQFRFVICPGSSHTEGKIAGQSARSHAISWALAKKREMQHKSGENFRLMTPSHIDRTSVQREVGQELPTEEDVPVHAPGPLQALTANSPRLRAMINDYEAQHDAPSFTVSDELVLRNFSSVLKNGLEDDDELFCSVMFTFVCAVTGGSLENECLGHQMEAFTLIRERMSCPDKATSEMTLVAILLLAGIEARLGTGSSHVQLHMGAIQELLYVCQKQGSYLSDGIKRAIFWQDLDLSVMTGSNRIVSHTTFSELEWKREYLSPKFFALPPGFRDLSSVLGNDFVEVLKDIYALQCVRDSALFGKEDAISMAQIDNHQASIQSRLNKLPKRSLLSECCYLAAYLCSAMLRCKLWRTSTVPSHLSLQLLWKLQQALNSHVLWIEHPALLVWLLHIGGAFAPEGKARSDYIRLLHMNISLGLDVLYTPWSSLLGIMNDFIWSEKAFRSQVEVFWEEASLCAVA